nr:DUF2804 domain-containing protein [Clostridiales bacterium]
MEQVQIKEPIPLLDENGNVLKPGYCKTPLYEYKRSAIKANPLRIKEWDFYQFSNKRYTTQITAGDISMAGAGSFGFFDRMTGEHFDILRPMPLTLGRLGLGENAETPNTVRIKNINFDLTIVSTKKKRSISFKGKDIRGRSAEAEIEAEIPEGLESLVMAVPFKEKGHFYYNQKVNSMPVKGYVKAGDMFAEYKPETDFLILDWGRGVWPYKVHWYWGNGTYRMKDGRTFGFEIGWGFGDMSAATENMIFCNGKGHKIGKIALEYDKSDLMKPWHFISDDGKFDLTMTPEYDNATSALVLGLVGSKCHQVYGKWNGTAVLDSGEVLKIENMLAFCEDVTNRW